VPAPLDQARGHSGRYRERDQELIQIARAAARSRRGSVISHRSAALIHGLPLLGRVPVEPSLTVPPRAADRTSAAHIHRATLPAAEVVCVDGVRVTSVARTIIDLGRWLPAHDAVAAADYALHEHLTTSAEVETVLLRCWNWPRIGRASRSLSLTDARSESALESISRLTLGWLRLPSPELQTVIRDAHGALLGRVDFYWDEFGVVGEADGSGKYESSGTSLLDEKRRQERLEHAGLVVIRWGWDDITRHPSELRTRLRSAFDRGRRRDRSGFHREWSVRAPRSGHSG
jgi:very-short-patch-repair endonuclease